MHFVVNIPASTVLYNEISLSSDCKTKFSKKSQETFHYSTKKESFDFAAHWNLN